MHSLANGHYVCVSSELGSLSMHSSGPEVLHLGPRNQTSKQNRLANKQRPPTTLQETSISLCNGDHKALKGGAGGRAGSTRCFSLMLVLSPYPDNITQVRQERALSLMAARIANTVVPVFKYRYHVMYTPSYLEMILTSL